MSDNKTAIVTILLITTVLATTSYLSGVASETLIMGLSSAGIAAVAGLSGYEVGKNSS